MKFTSEVKSEVKSEVMSEVVDDVEKFDSSCLLLSDLGHEFCPSIMAENGLVSTGPVLAIIILLRKRMFL